VEELAETGMLVEKRTMVLRQPFQTGAGTSLLDAPVAYEEYGNPEGPAILLCHGGLSSPHAAGRYHASDPAPGWWDGLVGPGRPFDTERFRILSSNALGGMYGSCSPLSTDPRTGNRYGPTFPALTLVDQVRFQAAFLDALGIDRLWCMAGPSMGSLHTLTFAALYPQRLERAVAVATAARMTASGMAIHHVMTDAFRSDPGFQAGWYPPGVPLVAARLIWQLIKLYYTSERLFQVTCADPVPQGPGAQAVRAANTRTFLLEGLEAGIAPYDPNCFMATLAAVNTHDLGEGFPTLEAGIRRIQCPLLLVNLDSDQEFPPHAAGEIAELLNAVRPGQATLRVLGSPWGHLGCVRETEALAACLREWLDGRT
jgi:homoserine O-acetyltransferase